MRAIDAKEKCCKQCKEIKTITDFYKQKQVNEKGAVWLYFDTLCKPCRLLYGYARRKNVKLQAVLYLGGKCKICGFDDLERLEVFDCHHRDPNEKDFSIFHQGGKSFKSIKPELDKCDLLCSNCHRTVHQNQSIESLA